MRDEDLKREMLAVPREPTKVMLAAVAKADWMGGKDLDWRDGWQVMWDAARLSAEPTASIEPAYNPIPVDYTKPASDFNAASAEATEREGVSPVVAKHLPLRINEHTSSTIITAAGDRISVSWSDTRLENPHSEAEAFAAFIVEACNAYAALRYQTPALVSSDPASDTQVSDGTVTGLREAAQLALMYLDTGFIECPRCGEEVSTKHTDAEHTLREALTDGPDPAPSGKEPGNG